MADKKLQYVIEMIADDQKIRQQMKSWDWEEIMGLSGKEFGQILADGASHGKEEIIRAFKGLNIDWTKILGTDQLRQLEQSLTRTLAKKRASIEWFIANGDTKQLEETVDIVAKLGEEMASLGSDFDAASLTRGFGALMKALKPFANETHKIELAFNTLFNRINNGTHQTIQSSEKIASVMAKIESATKRTGGAQATLDNTIKRLKEVENLKLPDLSSFSLEQLEDQIDALDEKWENLEERFAGKRKTDKFKAEQGKLLKEMLHINDAIVKKGGLSYYDDDVARDMQADINKIVKEFKEAIEELKQKLESDTFAQAISKQLSDVKIKLSLDDKAKETFKNSLKDFITEINNNNDITTAKVKVDWAFNPDQTFESVFKNDKKIDNIKAALQDAIKDASDELDKLAEDEFKYRDSATPNDLHKYKVITNRIETLKELKKTNQYLLDNADDAAVQAALTSSLNSFKAVQKVVGSKQDAILSKTHEWRQKMIDAMQIEKTDVNIQLGFDKGLEASVDNLYNYLQQYFEENQIELHINKDAFVKEIKDAVENSGVSVGSIGGGGTVDLNPQSLKTAIAEGLLAALTGDFAPLDSGRSTTKAQPTSKQKSVYLDPSSEYMKHMAEAVRSFAEYAQKDTAPAAKIREFFDKKFIEYDKNGKPEDFKIEQYADASPMKIANMLSLLLEKYGTTLLDEFDNLIKDVGKNRVVQNFRGDLSELLYYQNIGQKTLTDEERRAHSIDVFNDLVKKSKMLEPFNIKNPKWQTPEIADFNDIFTMATSGLDKTGAEYKKAVEQFDALKTIIANEDGLDAEAQKERLQTAIVGFRESIRDTYDTLSKYINAFEMDVFVKGAKKPYRVSSRSSILRAQTAIGDDSTKLSDVRIYKDINTAALGTTRRNQELKMLYTPGAKYNLTVPYPDRTDILYKDTSVDDFEKSKNTVKPWKDDSVAVESAAKRATKAADLLKTSEERAAKLAEAETSIQKQITEKNAHKAELENEIATNQENIAKLNTNSRKIAGARTRLTNRQTALSAAEKAQKEAELNKKIVEGTDFSERDTELSDIFQKRAKYEAWMKNPEEYDDDIVDTLYDGIMRSYRSYKEAAEKELNRLNNVITNTPQKLSELRAKASVATQNGDLKALQKIEEEIRQAQQNQNAASKSLPSTQAEYNKYTQLLSEIYAKIARDTEADKAAFDSDFQAYISKQLKELDVREANIGADPREEAETRLSKAQKDYQKAQKEYDKVASSEEGKAVVEIDRLKVENKTLETQVVNLSKDLKEAEQKQTQIAQDKQSATTTARLGLAPQQDAVYTLIDEANQLNQDIYQAQKDAEALDTKVKEMTEADGYKKPKYDIKHTKSNQKKVDRYYALFNRSLNLTDIANGSYDFSNGTPNNLTATMQKIVDSLVSSREVVKLLSDNLVLDKYDTDEALKTEVNARLSRHNEGTNKLSPITEEFYQKIINDGRVIAQQWLESTIATNSQNIIAQETKLRNLAQGDSASAQQLESAVFTAEKSLGLMFKDRIDKWTNSIREKIALLAKGDLSLEAEALTRYEIDELFQLVQQAEDKHTRNYKHATLPITETNQIINETNAQLVELEQAKVDIHNKIDPVQENEIQQQIKTAKKNLKDYQQKRKDLIEVANKNGVVPELSWVDSAIHELEKSISELSNKSNVSKEQDIDKQIHAARRRLKHAKKLRKHQVKQASPWINNIFDQEQEALLQHRADYRYDSYLNKNEKEYIASRNVVRSDIDSNLMQRESLLYTRQAELLKEIQEKAKSGTTDEKLETELKGINEELAKYAQYSHLLENDSLVSIFQGDAEFAEKYKCALSEIIKMEQDADLAKAKSASRKDLNNHYLNIDAKRSDLDTFVYDKLQSKQNTLLTDNISSLYQYKAALETQATALSNARTEAKNAGKPIDEFTDQLQDVNKKIRENNESIAKTELLLANVNKALTPLELNKRRSEDMNISGIAYKADEAVMRVYNETTQEAIELEQKLALERAKGLDATDTLGAQRSQNRKRTTAIERAQQEREQREAENSPRVQALRYLTKTEDAYTTALEKRATLNRRVKIKEAQIDDIENDQKYSTSWQYKRHQRVVKDRLVNEYVGSEKYTNDRVAGITNTKTAMKEYLEQTWSPEIAEKILYQLEQTLTKNGEKINTSSLEEMFNDILRDNVEYQQYIQDRQAEYQKILGASVGTVDTGVSDLNLAIDAMHNSRDALEAGKERIKQEKQANIAFISSVSEKDYQPLWQEMQNVASRVDFESMMFGFNNVVAQNRSREATINNLKHQVLKSGGNQTEANRLAEELKNIGDTALKDVRTWSQRFLPQIFLTTEDEFREQARKNLIANEERYATKEVGVLQRAYTRDEKEVRSIFNRETNKGTDAFVSKYFGNSIDRLQASDFQDVTSTQFKEIVNTFKSLLEDNVYNLVSNYAESLVVEHGKLDGIDIRAEVRNMLLKELDILQQQQPDIDTNIAHIEAQRKAAMQFGGIGYGEIADADVLREQAVLTSKLTAEKAKQKELSTQIAALEKTENSAEELGRLNKELDETNNSIATLQMLVDNRDTLLDLQHQAKDDEKAEQQWTPEKQKLWLTNKLEVARANLDSNDEAVRNVAEQQVARYTEMLNNLESKIATEEAERRKDSSIIGVMTKALKDAFGGKGGFALDATGIASEATLSEILQLLSGLVGAFGGKLVRDPEMDKKLTRMRELETKRGVASEPTTQAKTEKKKKLENKQKEAPVEVEVKPVLDSNKKEIIAGTNMNDLKSGQKDDYAKYIGRSVGGYKTSDSIFSNENALKEKVKELQGIMANSAQDSEEYLKAMVEMSRLISTWRNVVKQTQPEMKDNVKWQEYLTTGDGKLFDKTSDIPVGSISSRSKVTLKQTAMNLGTKISENAKNALFVAKEEVKTAEKKADAKEREANAEKTITEEKQKATTGWTNSEKAEYEKLSKETKGYSAKVVFDEGGFALESTLQDILTVIKKIKTEGIQKGGSVSNSTSKDKNKTEADLIRDRALSQDDTVKGLAAGRGDLYNKYMTEVTALNQAVESANNAKKNKKTPDMQAVKAAAEKVSALTKNILRDTANWDYTVNQSDIVKDFTLPKDQKMTKEIIENAIQGTFDPKKEKYDFLSFDNDKLTYKLTDIQGKVRTITAEWNDFNQQLAITSDKSVGSLDPLVAKVDELTTKFKNAQTVGYLKDDDNNLAKFTTKLTELANAKTFADVERLRHEAIAIGDSINKTINQNKGWMVGTGAKKQLDSQYNKIIGARQANVEDVAPQFADDSRLFTAYNDAYVQLNKVYQQYVDSHQLNDPKIQQQLQQEASKVQILGKKYLSSVTQAEKLNEFVAQSGIYTDKKTGEQRALGGIGQVTAQEFTNLEEKMRNFVQTDLKQANIEAVKFDAVNQKLTYTFRTSKNTVADMVVQYNDATKALYAYQKQERESLTGFAGFMQSMKGKLKSILQYTASITSIYRVFGELKRGIQYIREIDSALTELKKVTDETEETYNKFLQTAAKTADKVGSTIKEVVSSTADWARLGYSLEDAATLAETTSVLLNVSEFQSIEDATSALTSTLQAFSMTAETSMHAVDVLNEIGKLVAYR